MVPDYDATALTSQGYTTVTVCVNGVVRTILSEIRVVDGTTVVTVDAYQFPENAYYTLTLPTRDPTFPDLPKYEIPAWLREQRRIPKNKRHVPAFKPGPGRTHRRGAY